MANTPLKNEGFKPLNENDANTLNRKELASKPVEKITPFEWSALGHTKMPILRVIRARCIDCCTGNYSEVRKCEAVECPSWPYRTGRNPLRQKGAKNDRPNAT